MKRSQDVYKAMELLRIQAQHWGQPLNAKQLASLHRYAQLLSTYTEANVIGSKEVRSILLDHLLDSLSCLSLKEVELRGKIIDVGAGGGLPGIPLAIARSELSVTSLEATKKKVKFLQHVKEELRLSNLHVLHARAEDAALDKQFKDGHNFAVARALASLPVVLEYCAPFVRMGGIILAMKGRIEEDELLASGRAALKIGAELHRVTQIHLCPELAQKQRHIMIFYKTAPTPSSFPRRTGLAKKRPLGS